MNTEVPIGWFSRTFAVAGRFGKSGRTGAGVVVVGRDSTRTVTSEVPERGGVPRSVAVTVSVYEVPAGEPERSTYKHELVAVMSLYRVNLAVHVS